MPTQQANFPFCAISGQASFKLALILADINPSIGGVLIAGPRGMAKSTLARSFADIIKTNNRFVTLPLSATEEMLVGTLDLQKVLSDKDVDFNPGILSKVNNGVLYVDEVNLLPDGLVDLLLDVSASGINHVERDGISHSHASRFLLLGTMNPDEGELRPQLLDRFGLSVNLSNKYSIQERIDIVKLRETFESNPVQFIQNYDVQQKELKTKITFAKQSLDKIKCSNEIRHLIAESCDKANVDGLRADIVWYRAALAHAAWSQRSEINEHDVLAVEELVLSHRRKNDGAGSNSNGNGDNDNNTLSHDSPNHPFKRPDTNNQDQAGSDYSGNSGEWGSMSPQQQRTAETIDLPFDVMLKNKKINVDQEVPYSELVAKNTKGYVSGGSRTRNKVSTCPNWFKTLTNALGQWPPKTLHYKKAKQGQSILNLILLDTSASILKNQQFAKAKSVVLAISEQAYLQREQLSVFGFGNQQVELLIPKKRAPKELRQWLDTITAAGGTPLREMLVQAFQYQKRLQLKSPSLLIKTFLITDGRTTQNLKDICLLGDNFLLDVESTTVKRGRGSEIALQLGAEYHPL